MLTSSFLTILVDYNIPGLFIVRPSVKKFPWKLFFKILSWATNKNIVCTCALIYKTNFTIPVLLVFGAYRCHSSHIPPTKNLKIIILSLFGTHKESKNSYSDIYILHRKSIYIVAKCLVNHILEPQTSWPWTLLWIGKLTLPGITLAIRLKQNWCKSWT